MYIVALFPRIDAIIVVILFSFVIYKIEYNYGYSNVKDFKRLKKENARFRTMAIFFLKKKKTMASNLYGNVTNALKSNVMDEFI